MRQAREMTALEQTDVPALVNQERAERLQNMEARDKKRKHSYSYGMGGGSLKLWQNSLNTTTLPGAVSALSIYGVLGIENAPSGGLEDEVEVKKRGGSSSCGGVGGAGGVPSKRGRL
jgi:hypothetical protein